MKTIQELQAEAHDIATAKGWHEDDRPDDPHWLTACLALIGCEVSEAVEAVRDGDLVVSFREDKYGNMKPEGLGIELADVVLRCLDFAEAKGIDLEACIETKMAFNRTRTHRHGGRAL